MNGSDENWLIVSFWKHNLRQVNHFRQNSEQHYQQNFLLRLKKLGIVVNKENENSHFEIYINNHNFEE